MGSKVGANEGTSAVGRGVSAAERTVHRPSARPDRRCRAGRVVAERGGGRDHQRQNQHYFGRVSLQNRNFKTDNAVIREHKNDPLASAAQGRPPNERQRCSRAPQRAVGGIAAQMVPYTIDKSASLSHTSAGNTPTVVLQEVGVTPYVARGQSPSPSQPRPMASVRGALTLWIAAAACRMRPLAVFCSRSIGGQLADNSSL